MNVFKFSMFVIILLSFASYFFSTIKVMSLLFIGIFLLRLSGQGLMSHTATTTVSRFFEKTRGKALSVTWLGLSAAEFVLPVLTVFLLTLISWREIWLIISLLVLFILPIVSFLLIKKLKIDSRENSKNDKINNNIKQWNRSEVIKDFRFYIIALNMLGMPSVATGIFVYQSFIISSKGWTSFIFAQSFMAYSFLSVITLFASGFLIDKFTSRKLLIYMNIPLLLAVIVLNLFENPLSSFVLLGLVGISNGFANVLGSSTWAEIYGVKYLGGIKSITTAMMVFATATGAATFGILIDKGYSINFIALISGIYITFSLILLLVFRKKIEPVYL